MLAEMSRGALRVIGWVGDQVPWQASVLFAASGMSTEKLDAVSRFLRAYRRGARDYQDAFTAAGSRKDSSTAPEILSIIARRLGLPAEQVRAGIAYVDADARLDVPDILRQVALYRKQGLLDGAGAPEAMIDRSYVIPLPQR